MCCNDGNTSNHSNVPFRLHVCVVTMVEMTVGASEFVADHELGFLRPQMIVHLLQDADHRTGIVRLVVLNVCVKLLQRVRERVNERRKEERD